MAASFKGGIHPEGHKDSAGKSIEVLAAPELLVFPMSQHIGAPCTPVVAVGDRVKIGQLIGDSEAPMSSKIHASVSGVVKAIGPRYHPNGVKVNAIVIENDFEDEISETVQPCKQAMEELSSEDVVQMVHQAGIVGMGGAGFPAHIKLRAAIQGGVDTLIINGAECEPYLTSDHRLMLEDGSDILLGMSLLMHALSLKTATLAIENNKMDAVAAMKKLVKEKDLPITVAALRAKYPQGGEKQLIMALTGRQVPPGKFPADVKCAVFNVDTCASVARAYRQGFPVHRRVVTVAGSAIARSKNLSVRVGTPFKDLIDACGGFVEEPRKVIMGGPMMGIGQHTLDVPVIKTTSGILCFTEQEGVEPSYSVCIRCGKCVRACPMFLQPCYMGIFARNDQLEECEKMGIASCIECGACTYICPGRMYLVQEFRIAKLKIAENKRREKEKQAAKEAKKKQEMEGTGNG